MVVTMAHRPTKELLCEALDGRGAHFQWVKLHGSRNLRRTTARVSKTMGSRALTLFRRRIVVKGVFTRSVFLSARRDA